MTVEPPPAEARVSRSLRRQIAIAAVNAVSFGLADVVPSRRHRWLIRVAMHGGAVGSSVPAMRRSAPQLRRSWRQLRGASPQTRRVASVVVSGVMITAGLIMFGWYRLLVRSAGALAARNVRYPRLMIGVASELFASALSARLRRASIARRSDRRSAPAS